MSPTARTVKLLRDQGYRVDVVEKWVRTGTGGIRKDLFGIIDILAMRPGEPIIAIQATSGSNVSARIKKLHDTPATQEWLSTGNRIQVVGWRKVCVRRKDGSLSSRKVWRPDTREIEIGGVE